MASLILWLGGIAGAVASIWGVCKIVGTIAGYIRRITQDRREHRDAPLREIMAQMQKTRQSVESLRDKMDSFEAQMHEIRQGQDEVARNIVTLDDGVATLQGDRLNQAFTFYVEQQHPCPMHVKESLSEMCRQYQNRGRNHLKEHYLEQLEKCPTGEVRSG